MPLPKPKVNYLFNFHLKFYLSVDSHFPQWSTALTEFTEVTAHITTKKEQCGFAGLQRGGVCLPARGGNSLRHTQPCSGQDLECTTATLNAFELGLWGLWEVIKIQVLNSCVFSFCNMLSVLRRLRAERNHSQWTDTRSLHRTGCLGAEYRCLSPHPAGDCAEEIARGANVTSKGVNRSWVCSGFTLWPWESDAGGNKRRWWRCVH